MKKIDALKALRDLLKGEKKQQFTSVTTADGATLELEPGMEQGATVMIAGQPAPDGTYTVEGKMIMVSGGKIAEIKVEDEMAAAVGEIQQAMKSQVAELVKAEFKAVTDRVTALETENKALKTAQEKAAEDLKGYTEMKQKFAALEKGVEDAISAAENNPDNGKGGGKQPEGRVTKADKIAAMVGAKNEK